MRSISLFLILSALVTVEQSAGAGRPIQNGLSLVIPLMIQEGNSTSGTATISRKLETPLTVELASTAPGLTFPATVTIPAGAINATFPITAVDNSDRDGSRNVSIKASAVFYASAAATATMTIRDDDIAGYRFGALTDIVNVNRPVQTTLAAIDIEGNAIVNAAEVVELSLILPDGSTRSVVPEKVTLAGAQGWAGSITLPAVSSPPLRLCARDAAGYRGESSPFDIMRVLPAHRLRPRLGCKPQPHLRKRARHRERVRKPRGRDRSEPSRDRGRGADWPKPWATCVDCSRRKSLRLSFRQ